MASTELWISIAALPSALWWWVAGLPFLVRLPHAFRRRAWKRMAPEEKGTELYLSWLGVLAGFSLTGLAIAAVPSPVASPGTASPGVFDIALSFVLFMFAIALHKTKQWWVQELLLDAARDAGMWTLLLFVLRVSRPHLEANQFVLLAAMSAAGWLWLVTASAWQTFSILMPTSVDRVSARPSLLSRWRTWRATRGTRNLAQQDASSSDHKGPSAVVPVPTAEAAVVRPPDPKKAEGGSRR